MKRLRQKNKLNFLEYKIETNILNQIKKRKNTVKYVAFP